jgi:hypothetical protein
MKEQNRPDGLAEQLIVSASVLRQAKNLPPEMVETHLNMLAAYGIVGQALNELLSIDKNEWLKRIDRIQQNERSYK